MSQYKLKEYKHYKLGEEIRLEKITAAERIFNKIAKGLILWAAALFLFNLIRFIF